MDDTTVEKKTDAFILAGSPVKIKLFEKEYTFLAQTRREARNVRVRLFDITRLCVDVGICADTERAGKMLEAVGLIQNFCEDYCIEMKIDMDEIDQEIVSKGMAGYAEVIGSFQPVADAWLVPYLQSTDTKKKKIPKKKK